MDICKLQSVRRMLTVLAIVVMCALSASAQIYQLEGMVGGKYPIVMELTKHDSGYVTGKYAYKSTLSKNGNNPCSWLDIFPGYENPQTCWAVRDCNLNTQEDWTNVRFNGSTLSARMKNAKGNVYDITARVISSKPAPDDLAEHYRSNLGRCARDIAMFYDPDIQGRLVTLMGEPSFNYLASIIEVDYSIEYRTGMFWGGGYRARQCCDPAAIWAYDTDTKAFYIWIRKDGREYTWSETGRLPIKFQELVNEKF